MRYIIYIVHPWVDTFAGGLLVLQVIFRPVVRTTLLKLNKNLQHTDVLECATLYFLCLEDDALFAEFEQFSRNIPLKQ